MKLFLRKGEKKGAAKRAIPHSLWGERQSEAFFRKVFSLKVKPEKAVLRIFVDTGYELYLNARFVAGVDEWSNTRDYDVAAFLRAGQNIIAVKAMNHGGHRGFSLELSVFPRQGGVVSVISGASWRTFPEERWGWKARDYDAAGWKKPRVLFLQQAGAEQWKGRPGDNPAKVIPNLACTPFFHGGCPKCVDSPFFEAKKSPAETPRAVFDIIGREYQRNLDDFPPAIMFPAKIVEAHPGNGSLKNVAGILARRGPGMKIAAPHSFGGPSLIVDFGRETVGYLRLRTISESGVGLKLFFGETLTECFHFPPRVTLLYRMLTEDVAVAPGRQEWESNNRQGFRFVRIEFVNGRPPVEIQALSVRTSIYPVTNKGYFACSDPLLNKIWETGRRTLHLCMQEYYLDAIKRDRFLWVGDTRMEALINYYIFGDQELFRYSWKKIAETQYRDGGIPSSLGEGASMIWDYVAWWLIALVDYRLHTGDLKFAASLKENIVKAMDWLISKSGRDGLINVPANKTEGWMCVLNNKRGKDVLMNSLFHRSLRGVSEIMGDFGDLVRASKYGRLAQKTGKSLNRLQARAGTQTFREDHLASGSLGGFEIIEAFFKNRQPEEGLRFIREFWGPAIAAGSDTFWEGPVKDTGGRIDEKQVWTRDNYISRCHGWTAGPTYALLSEVAGIKPTRPGFAAFDVKPQLGKLAFVKGVVPTPRGLIAVAVKRGAGRLDETILVPKGCRARIGLPKLSNQTVQLNGKRLTGKRRAPIKLVAEADYLFVELRKPGLYVFRVDFN